MSSLSAFKNLSSKPKKEFKTRRQLEEEKEAPQKKQKVDSSQAPLPTPAKTAATPEKADESDLPPLEEVRRKLRSRNQPVTLFGESPRDRVARLRQVESNINADSLDQQNVFAQMMEQTDTDERSDPDLVKLEKLVPQTSSGPEDDLLIHFAMLLRMGGEELAKRPEAEAKSLAGKKAKTTWKQTLVYVLPLFRKLANRELETAILDPLTRILEAMKERDYAKCEDAYLLLAIGNEAWPMGVTSVGIHERAAREKISKGTGKAHVLNDEVARKFVTSVKRLISFSKKHFPGEKGVMW